MISTHTWQLPSLVRKADSSTYNLQVPLLDLQLLLQLFLCIYVPSSHLSTYGALLILLAMKIRVIASCPSSCMVCSEDITLCQGLTYILEKEFKLRFYTVHNNLSINAHPLGQGGCATTAVPASTKALIITDGSITSIEGFNLSFLLNATLLQLSTNGITTIRDDAFLGLRMLKTLFLDKNQISSTSITYSTFHELQKLQVLVLSNNVLTSIHGTWFKNMKDLIRLNLNGNQLTSITGDSFEMANLGKLRILDLSNNFINSIEKRAFSGLTQLMEIDLSRNRLAVIPDTFSPLPQLSFLNLDQNWWNCTCKLYDLASFLRKYTNSSSRTLRNADNMSCRASENPSVINLLELTEVNCKSALKHPPGVIKNRRRNYGQDIALVAIFSFLGGVGLTCLVLAVFNRKLQYGKANERSSENCCCRTPDESQCGHEPRNYLTKGYCNCHLTRENDIKVMSMLGSGREMPLLQENGHQETVKAVSKCTGPEMPLRSTEKWNEQMKNDHFLCLNYRLLQSYPQESSGNTAESNEADVPHQKHVQIRNIRSPENTGHWEEDLLTTRLEGYPKVNQRIRSDIFCGRCSSPPCALVRESLGKHLTNDLCLSLSKTGDNDHLKSQRQSGLFAALCSATNSPEESKEHSMQAELEGQCSRQNDQCGSLARNKNISPQLENFLICKYTDCDKYQDYLTAKKENHGKNLRLEKEQSEVKRRRVAACSKNDEEVPLSPAMKRMYQPKSVSFYVPDQVMVKREDVKTSGLNEERSLEDKPQHECIQGSPSATLARRLLNTSEAKDKERQSSPTPVVPEEKVDELTQKNKSKTQGQDSLTVKLNLHPFRKARVHPKEPLKEKADEYPCCQHLQLPHVSKKEETRKKRKRKPNHSVAAPDISGNSKQIIYSVVAVGEIPEKNDKHAVASLSGPHSKNISPLKITEGTSSSKHSQTLSCTSRSPPFSPNGTSGMIVSITALSSNHSPSISQNAANNIPTSVNSKEEDATETEVMPFHQNEAKERDGSLSLFSLAENLDFQNPSNEDNLELQQVTENVVQSMDLEQLNHKQLKRQDESLTVKDEMEDHKRTGEPEEPLKGELVSRVFHSSGEKAPSNGHQIPREEDTNRPKSPVHLNSAISNCQTIDFLITSEGSQTLHEAKDMKEYGTKQLRADFKTESIELTKMCIPNTAMDSLGLKKEEPVTEDGWENNKYKTLPKNTIKVTIISNTSSVPSSPKTGNTPMDKNVNLEMKNNEHIPNGNNLQEAPNNQLDEGSSEYKEGKMPTATCQEHSLFLQSKDVNYEEQIETSLLPSDTNKAEISASQLTLSPPYTDYDKELSLQVEQRKANISNNTHPSLVLFKDKKPFSI